MAYRICQYIKCTYSIIAAKEWLPAHEANQRAIQASITDFLRMERHFRATFHAPFQLVD